MNSYDVFVSQAELDYKRERFSRPVHRRRRWSRLRGRGGSTGGSPGAVRR